MSQSKDIKPGLEVVSLSEGWLKAAVIGSLWASVEIILGSFLHNIKMPMSGTIMSFISVMLLVAFSGLWRERWIIFKAGIICALMKSVSPSAIIFGPMVGIMMEATLIEISLLLFGRNLFAYLIGGAFAVSGVLIQKVVHLLLAFGLNFAYIFSNLVAYSAKQLSINGINPRSALLLLIAIYLVSGVTASLTGFILGKKVNKQTPDTGTFLRQNTDRRHPLFEQNNPNKYYSLLLIIHLIVPILSLIVINRDPSFYLFIPLVYVILTLFWYRNIVRRLFRPFFWVQLLVITLLASIFLTGFRNGALFTKEGIIAGLLMDLRAVLIFTAFSAISIELRNPLIKKILYGKGFGKLYAAAGLAFAALPGILASSPRGREVIRRPGSVITSMVLSGNSLFNRFRAEAEQSTPVILITGEVMKGKTTFTLELITRLESAGIKPEGFIARGVESGKERTGFDLVNLETGERILLSRKEPVPENWIRFGRYCFNPDTFEHVNLEVRMMAERIPGLIILDEVGPLELQNQGWAPAIEYLLDLNKIVQLWVVRNSMLEKIIKKWNLRNVIILDINTETPDTSFETVRTILEENSSTTG